jgi:NAD(P)-dependent dehydrogenase (short-subunit alcohol dehydrogenase family)
MEKRNYLVTGAAGGIGRAITELLAADGHRVFAGDINPGPTPEMEHSGEIIPVMMDVACEESVLSAAETVGSRCAGLHGIINIAGIFCTAPLVETDAEVFSKILETNLTGMYRVNRHFFPLLYAERGRIVNLSSETARLSACFNGLYSMTKYGVEAYSDALRRELQLLDIKVSIVQPGPVETALLLSNRPCFMEAAANSVYFSQYLKKIADLVEREQKKAVQPLSVAAVIRKALYSKRPRIRYRINNDVTRHILALLPARLTDRLFKAVLKRPR